MSQSRAPAFRRIDHDPRVVEEAQRDHAARERRAFDRWAELVEHRRILTETVDRRAFDDLRLDPRAEVSLRALQEAADSAALPVRDGPTTGPPVFDVGPGLNFLGPPYDFGLSVALGTNLPAVLTDLAWGGFGVNATALDGKYTYGSAGVALFIRPSDPARTLAIRPYFQWSYRFSCHSPGPPTSHSIAVVYAGASGRRNGGSIPFPTKSRQLWAAGSDLWDDASGEDEGVFVGTDSEVIVTGADYYIAQFSCTVSADSNGHDPWRAVTYNELHCRVPFLVVEEF